MDTGASGPDYTVSAAGIVVPNTTVASALDEIEVFLMH